MAEKSRSTCWLRWNAKIVLTAKTPFFPAVHQSPCAGPASDREQVPADVCALHPQPALPPAQRQRVRRVRDLGAHGTKRLLHDARGHHAVQRGERANECGILRCVARRCLLFNGWTVALVNFSKTPDESTGLGKIRRTPIVARSCAEKSFFPVTSPPTDGLCKKFESLPDQQLSSCIRKRKKLCQI